MRYSWDQGVEKHPESLSRSLIVGLPVVFAALILGPMKLAHTPTTAPQPTIAHNTVTALKRPFNLRSSGSSGANTAFSPPSGQTSAYTAGSSSTDSSSTGNTSSTPTSGTSSTNSSTPSSNDSSGTPASGGMGGGSGDSGSTTNSGPIPTSTVTIPGTSVVVDNKPIVTTSGLTLTLN